MSLFYLRTKHNNTQAPSTCIQIFLNPPLFHFACSSHLRRFRRMRQQIRIFFNLLSVWTGKSGNFRNRWHSKIVSSLLPNPDTNWCVWTGESDLNASHVDEEMFGSGKKKLRIQKYPDTCGRSQESFLPRKKQFLNFFNEAIVKCAKCCSGAIL